jgi:hypothetical protein
MDKTARAVVLQAPMGEAFSHNLGLPNLKKFSTPIQKTKSAFTFPMTKSKIRLLYSSS